jgi:hypothetical protein
VRAIEVRQPAFCVVPHSIIVKFSEPRA